MTDDRSKALVPQSPSSLAPVSRLAERTLAERGERQTVRTAEADRLSIEADVADWAPHIRHIEGRLTELLADPYTLLFIIVGAKVRENVYVQYTVQVEQDEPSSLYDEAVGEFYLEEGVWRLRRDSLIRIGYNPPDQRASTGAGNFWREWQRPIDEHKIAVAAIDALRFGYGIQAHDGITVSDPWKDTHS